MDDKDMTERGMCGPDLYWELNGRTLTISGTGKMHDFLCWPDDYNNKEGAELDLPDWPIDIERVIIEDGVTSIGDQAFDISHSLTEVTIPESVTVIGNGAFQGCSSLTHITIPSGVTFIGDSAFRECTALTEVKIPERVSRIEKHCFEECSALRSVTIPGSVNSIGDDAFCGCESLTEVTIPESVTEIGEGAFYGCLALEHIRIPQGVKKIGNQLFFLCHSLTEMIIPEGVMEIGKDAFVDCRSLTEVSIPESVTEIGENAFHNCTKLTEVKIPANVMEIGAGAFSGCSGLTKAAIPEGVTAINASVFCWCSALTEVIIPCSVTKIGVKAFCGCSSLKEVNIPTGVTAIEGGAFSGCSSLVHVSLPSGIRRIAGRTFTQCSSLESIDIDEGVKKVYPNAFHGCLKLTDVSFGGTEEDWRNIKIEQGNEALLAAKMHCNYDPTGAVLKQITEEMFYTRFPFCNYDYFSGLENKELYLNEYVLYVRLLVKYLIRHTSIKRVDDEMKNYRLNGYGNEKIQESEQDLYQYLCNDYLDYFYIRNNVYIERLSEEEKEYLDSKLLSGDYLLDKKADEFIKNTFEKVTYEDAGRGSGRFRLNFGPGSNEDFFADNDSVVIGARMVPGMSITEDERDYFKRIGYFTETLNNLEYIMSWQLEREVRVIEYSDFSVKELF